MRVAVVHHTLTSVGGAEKVFTYTVQALNEAGIVPDVHSLSPEPPRTLGSYYGVSPRYRAVKRGVALNLPVFGIYQRLIISLIAGRMKGYDVVVNTTGVYTPLKISRGTKYVLYVYSPMTSVYGSIVAKQDFTGYDKYAKNMFWRLYYKPFETVVRYTLRDLDNAILLSVSKFTQERIRKYWGRDSTVVYPPVDCDLFSQADGDYPRRNGVMTLARFTPEKNYMTVLDLAERMPDVRFRLVGTARVPSARIHLEKLKREVQRRGLSNVEFYPNLDVGRLLNIMAESKVLVHAMRNEDLGLAPAEATCAGVLPAVIDSGGLREVVPRPDHRWRDLDEAEKVVRRLLDLDGERHVERVAELRHHIVRNFNPEDFKKAMRRHILE